MRAKSALLILALISTVKSETTCGVGFSLYEDKCVDDDECAYPRPVCGQNANCFNTDGSFYCQCKEGYRTPSRAVNLTVHPTSKCQDINECDDKDLCGPNTKCFNTVPNYYCTCKEGFQSSTEVKTFNRTDNVSCIDQDECKDKNVCGSNATCINTQGSYNCTCNAGYIPKSGNMTIIGERQQCEDICKTDETICGNGTCHQGTSGHYCACSAGFTNYGNNKSRCSELDCGIFRDVNNLAENFHIVQDGVKLLSKRCLKLMENADVEELNGEGLLESLLSIIDHILSTGFLTSSRKVSSFLDLVEHSLRFIGPFIKPPGTNRSTKQTEIQLLVYTGSTVPRGLKTLQSKHAKLDIMLEEAAGDISSYPGHTTVSLLSYLNLEETANGYFSGMEKTENQRFKVNSKVVTVTVSNRDTKHLKEPVNITLHHLDQSHQTLHTCVFWDSSKDGGSWSSRGCSMVESNSEYTVCSCNHLHSFAVLMALYDIEVLKKTLYHKKSDSW